MNNASKISQLLDLEEDISELQARLDGCYQQAAELRDEVQQAVVEAANRFLVNEQGQPVDGGLYWWRQRAIVRVSGMVKIIPLQTMDEEKIWPNGTAPDEEACPVIPERGIVEGEA
jgi:hypothetical protein